MTRQPIVTLNRRRPPELRHKGGADSKIMQEIYLHDGFLRAVQNRSYLILQTAQKANVRFHFLKYFSQSPH